MEPEKFKKPDVNLTPNPEQISEDKTIEKKGLTKKEKILAAFAIAVFVSEIAGMSLGINRSINNIKKYVHPTTTTTVETTQPSQTTTTESITTTTENAQAQKVESYSKAMEKYKEMSVEKFEALPRDEQLLYSQFLIDRTVSTGGYNYAYGKGRVGQAFAVEYTPVSIDNNGQEIIDNDLHTNQVSFLQSELADSGYKLQYNVIDGQKCLSSIYYEVGDQKTVTNQYVDDKAYKATLTETVCLANKYTATNTSEMLDGTDSDGNKIQFKVVTYDDQRGETFDAYFIYHKFTSYDGTSQAIWLLSDQYKH